MLFISWTALILLHDGDHFGPDGFGGGGCSKEENKSERMSLLLCVFHGSVLNSMSKSIDRY